MTPEPVTARRLREIWRDTSGQLLVEWVLLTAVIIIPLGALAPALLRMLGIYFYRIAGVMSLPFP